MLPNRKRNLHLYICSYFTILMVVLISCISDLFWVSDKVKHDISGKHGAAQNTCMYTRKNLLALRGNFKHALDSDTYARIKSLAILRSFRRKRGGKNRLKYGMSIKVFTMKY